MAQYLPLPDGSYVTIREGETPMAAWDRARKMYPEAFKGVGAEQSPQQETGLGAALVGGTKRFGSAIQTGIESIFDPEGAAQRGLERQEALGQQYAPVTSWDAVKQAYSERGLLPAAGEAISQIPGAVVEQAPLLGSIYAGGKAGAMAGGRAGGPRGALIGGLSGAAAPIFGQLFGSNLERQAEEGVDISRGRAAAAAIPGTALEFASLYIPLGRTVVGKLLGPQVEEALKRGATDVGEKLARETLWKTLAKGTGVGVAAEVPVEITQQMLERAQAGLPLLSDDALSEYGEAAYGATLVGGPLGAAGRAGQRYIARGEAQKAQSEERNLQEQIAEQERIAAEEAAEARLQTPEYRQELNDRFWTLKDELAQVEPIAKDKTQDEDVRAEAIARAKEIKKELTDIQAKMKASMKEAGAAPTLAKAKAEGPRQTQVVDEFGNIVKPKAKQMDDEEYGQKVDAAAAQWQDTQKKIQALRDKEAAEKQDKQEKTYAETQQGIQNYLAGLEEVEETNTQVLKQRLAAQQQRQEEDVAQDITLDRINLVLNNFGLRAAGVSPEVRKLVESKIDEGVVDRTVTKELGIQGLEGRTYRGEDATKVLPNIQSAIDALEERRQNAIASKQQLMDNKGQLTRAGYRLVANEAKLNELKRLRDVIQGRTPAETGVEGAVAGTLQAAEQARMEPLAVKIEPGKPAGMYKRQAENANRTATGSFNDIVALMDDYRQGRFFGEEASPAQRRLASSTREGLIQQSEDLRKDVVDNLITAIAYERQAQDLSPLTRDEAIGVGVKVSEALQEIITRSTALARGAALTDIVLEPAQMRGSEIVKEAKTALVDPRPLAERQFGSPRRAIEVLAEYIKQVKDDAVKAGKRPVSAERPLLRKQYSTAPTDLIQDLNRVLVMENLQPEVRDTLEQASRRFEEGGASVELEELVEEQVGRILRGTDRPFVLERDVTKPGGRRAMGAAGTAELLGEIQTQLRTDADLAQFAQGDQRTLVPRGKGFAEVDVQSDLFPESVAITRETPAQFQRLQKSAKVGKERARIAETKEKAEQAKRETLAAARAVEAELKPEAIQNRKRDLLGRINNLARETKQKIDASQFETPAQLMEKVKEPQVRSLLSRIEIAAKDLKAEDAEFEMSPAGIRLTWVPDTTLRKWAALDESIAAEAKKIKEFERIAARANEGSLEQRKARALAKQQRTAVQQVLAARKKLAAQTAEQQRALELRIKTGLGLPGVRATRKPKEQLLAELLKARKEKKKGETVKRPSKFEIVPLKSKAELDEEIAARQQEQLTDLRRRAKAATPETMFNKLKEEEAVAIQKVKEKERQLKQFTTAFPALQKIKAKEVAAEKALNAAKAAADNATAKKTALENKIDRLEEVRAETKANLAKLKKDSSEYAKGAAELKAIAAELQQAEAGVKTAEKDIAKAQKVVGLSRESFYDKAAAVTDTPQTLRMGEVKFNEFKKLSAEVDAAKANLASIRENRRLLEATQYVPESERKRQPSRGPIGGEVPWYDKKFTPDQMRNMSRMGLSAFDGGRSYSVDDTIDFRVGDTEGGGIDLDYAAKRMADVEKKAQAAGIKVQYFPTMGDVTMDILRSMSAQGMDVYSNRIRGGVKPDGTVFVVGENHDSMLDLEKTIAHEFVGHYTVEGVLGEKGMVSLMKKVDKDFAAKNNENGLEVLAKELGVLKEYTEAIVSTGRFYDGALADGSKTEKEVRELAKTNGLREIIAYTMEKRVDETFLQKAGRWLKELVGAMRNALRNMGLETLANPVLRKVGLKDLSGISTSDLFYLMKQAQKSFDAGKPIAYKKADGTVDFRATTPKYNPGLEEVGAIADRLVGRQKSVMDQVKANVSGLAARVQFVDRFAALEELGRRGVEKGIIDSLKAADMMYFSRMADQRHSFTAESANNGTPKIKEVKRPDGRMEKIIESERGANLKSISQKLQEANVGDADASGRLFTLYLAAERAMSLKDGINKLNFSGKITKADLEKALAFGRRNKAFQEARQMYNEYNKGLIDFAVQTGAISKEKGEALKKQGDYIPYYRMRSGVVDLVIGSESPIRIGDIKNQPYLEELVGGDEAIMDFFTSSLQNTSLLIDMALRNLATRNAAFVLNDMGIAEIHNGDGPATGDVIRFSMDEVDKDGKVVHRKKWARIDTKLKEEVFGDIPSDLVAKGMEGIKIIVPGVTRILGTPANWLRKFVTRDPRYALRQIFRDSMAAALVTGADIKPVVDTVGQIAKMYSKEGSESFRKLQQRGVLGGQVITGAPEDMAKIMQQITAGKPGWDMAMAKLDQWAQAGDAGTRMALYNSFLRQGLSEREATLGALESMNFGRRGVSPSMYVLNATIPFFNAGVQGIDVLYRSFRGRMPYDQQLQVKKKLLMRGGMMALLTMAYAAMMEDDEAYKNAPPEQRYGNWFVRIPGVAEPFRVPIPFEVGLLFKAVPEGIYNALFTEEKGSKVAKDLALQLARSLPGNPAETGVPVPTALKPFIETALNKSFFTGRDIVDARLDRLEKEFQYRDKTPEVLKTLGPAFAAIGLSPVQIENFIRSYTGSMGIGILSMVNPVFSSGKQAGDVAMRVSDYPLVGGLFQPNDAGRLIEEAYTTVKEVQQKKDTYGKLIAEGREDEADRYLDKNIGDIGFASYAGAFRQQMGELTKAEREIRALPASEMSPQEKRKELDFLRQLKIEMSADLQRARAELR
jgi:hypothetical protein